MSRDSNGDYSLPAGNPVVTNTDIESTWANTTLSDIANEISSSLDRAGRGGMLGDLVVAPFDISAGDIVATGDITTALGNVTSVRGVLRGSKDFPQDYAASDQTVSASTALVDDADIQQIPLEVDTVYAIEGYLVFAPSGTGGAVAILSLSNAEQYSAVDWDDNVHTPSHVTVGSGIASAGNGSGIEFGVSIKGTVHSHATLASLMKVRWSQISASGTTVRKKGSWLKLTKMGTA